MHDLQTKLLKILTKIDFSKSSLRKIAKMVGEQYPQKIKHHILQLEKKGLISVDWQNKTITRVKSGLFAPAGLPASGGKGAISSLLSIPVLGTANCGPATIFADQNIEGYLKISKNVLGLKAIGDFFAIKAFGNSMNRAKIAGRTIEQGDYVIVDPKQKSPHNGDYVLSIIDNVANIKKFFRDVKNKLIMLLSESTEEYPPIYIGQNENYFVSGKVIYVIKKPKLS
ncbi:MAG: S24 family peptidase [bacterium]|nr:S24 family peptidase [bacterium]